MISPRVARDLRDEDFDVVAIKSDRPGLEAVADREVLRRGAVEHRALVTNDVLDIQLIHNRMLADGDEHYGIIFTDDSSMPRNKASNPLWVRTLKQFLAANRSEDALRNRISFLTGSR